MKQSKSKVKGIIEAKKMKLDIKMNNKQINMEIKKMNDKQIQKFIDKNFDKKTYGKIDYQKLNNEKKLPFKKMIYLEKKNGVGFAEKGIDFPNTPEDLYEYHNTFLPSMNYPDEWVLTKTKKGFNAVLRNARK